METKFIRACFDIDCDWEGLPPAYRVFVNDELFAERTWTWPDAGICEILQIQAPPGRYKVNLQPVEPNLARFTTGKHRVEFGPGRWIDPQTLEIQ